MTGRTYRSGHGANIVYSEKDNLTRTTRRKRKEVEYLCVVKMFCVQGQRPIDQKNLGGDILVLAMSFCSGETWWLWWMCVLSKVQRGKGRFAMMAQPETRG